MKLTRIKLILAGSRIESHKYLDNPLVYGSSRTISRKVNQRIVIIDDASRLRKIKSRECSTRRAGSKFRKVVSSNAWLWKDSCGVPYDPIFVTLTFREDIRDIEIANKMFSSFIRRLNYHVFGKFKASNLKYVAVLEFQDETRNGVIHYHLIFFNLPKGTLEIITQTWTHGFVKVNKVDEIDNVKFYTSKTLSSKDSDDTPKTLSSEGGDARLDGHKRYFVSRGLYQPIEIRDEDKAKSILELIPKAYIPKMDIFNGYQGSVKRACYTLDRGKTLFDVISNPNEYIG
jgi:hypothetical protein